MALSPSGIQRNWYNVISGGYNVKLIGMCRSGMDNNRIYPDTYGQQQVTLYTCSSVLALTALK
jgi:hypothetical protein